MAADGSMQTTPLAAPQPGEAPPERKRRRWRGKRRKRRGWSSPAAQGCLPAGKPSAEMQEQKDEALGNGMERTGKAAEEALSRENQPVERKLLPFFPQNRARC